MSSWSQKEHSEHISTNEKDTHKTWAAELMHSNDWDIVLCRRDSDKQLNYGDERYVLLREHTDVQESERKEENKSNRGQRY